MSNRQIVFVRHAQPQIDPAMPPAEWTLSPEGAAAARALGASLKDFAFGCAVSSPEPKAVATAAAIAGPLRIPVAEDAGFAEHARRSVAFSSRAALEEGIAAFFAHPDRVAFGDESANACFDRFGAALARLPPEGDALVVSHGTILTLYLSRRFGFAPMPFWRGLGLPAAIAMRGRDFRLLTG